MALEDIQMYQMNYKTKQINLQIAKSELQSAIDDHRYQAKTLKRYVEQNAKARHTVPQSVIDEQRTKVSMARNKIISLENKVMASEVGVKKAAVDVERSQLKVIDTEVALRSSEEKHAKAIWDLEQTKVYAPADGYVTNFILREGQYVGILSRMQMYTNEKYVLMRVNHQAIRNVKVGQSAEFVSPVYPGKVFSAEVQGIVEATGEAQAGSMGREESVSQTTLKNVNNKFHFVRLKLEEPEGYDIPVGAVGLAWVSGDKPNHLLSFLDVIRGIIIRMKLRSTTYILFKSHFAPTSVGAFFNFFVHISASSSCMFGTEKLSSMVVPLFFSECM
ncbi:membrane fusion protein [Vibrio ishigakensis]|uniref:Membrane fusion protein n=1 Tax=Vibrio ishigakensis TaxID=1481914 RepID=A0A0B8P5K4_9VIBR|nr:membrane fusion protein [Vibrio ishigakensis]